MQFPWRWTSVTVSPNLDVIWGMSAQTVSTMRVRRGWAFVIDATIIGILWNVFDNFVVTPISEIVMTLAFALWFCLYFAVTEGTGKGHASLGKRVAKITVMSRNGGSLTGQRIVTRAAIVVAILYVEWQDLLFTVYPSAPLFIGSLASTIPVAFVLYNIWLAIWGPERRMLQDTLTSTEVKRVTAATTSYAATSATGQRQITWPRPVLCAVLVVTVSSLSLWFFQGPIGAGEERNIEIAIADEVGVRSRVDVTTIAKWGDSQFSINNWRGTSEFRHLAVSVWLPRTAWNDPTVQKTVETVVRTLTVEPGYFDSGALTIFTHIGGIATNSASCPGFVPARCRKRDLSPLFPPAY